MRALWLLLLALVACGGGNEEDMNSRSPSRDAEREQALHDATFPGGVYPVPGRFGVARPIDDVRIGATKTLAGFAPGTPVVAYPKVNLLRVSLQEIAAATGHPDKQFDTGSWVLAIEANVTRNWNAADPLVECVCPLLAKIKMGTGDANMNVEISPFPSASIPLPCDYVEVEITWDSFRPEDYGTTDNFLAVPEEVTVTASIERSVGSSDARRVFIGRGDGVGVSLLGRVPPMAKRVMVYSNTSAEVYAAGAIFRLRAADPNTEITTGTAAVLTTYTGPELAGIRNSGALADVPGAARWWIYTAPSITGGPVFIDYEIGL